MLSCIDVSKIPQFFTQSGATLLRLSRRFLPEINGINEALDRYQEDQTNTDLRKEIIEKYKVLARKTDNGHKLSTKFYQDNLYPLARRMHDMKLVDFKSGSEIPYNPKLGTGDRDSCRILATMDKREYDSIKDLIIQDIIKLADKNLKQHSKYLEGLETISNSSEPRATSLSTLLNEEISEINDQIDQAKNPELISEYRRRVSLLSTLATGVQNSKGIGGLSIDAKTRVLTNLKAIEMDYFTNLYLVEVAKDLKHKVDDLKDYETELNGVRKLTNRVKDLIGDSIYQAVLDYQLVDNEDRLSMLRDTLDTFKTLIEKTDMENPKVAERLAQVFHQSILIILNNLTNHPIERFNLEDFFDNINKKTDIRIGLGEDQASFEFSDGEGKFLPKLLENGFFEEAQILISAAG